MFQSFKILRISEDGLIQFSWTFTLFDDASELKLKCTAYSSASRPTKRHAFKVVKAYDYYHSGRLKFVGDAKLSADSFTIPQDVANDAIKFVTSKITVTK